MSPEGILGNMTERPNLPCGTGSFLFTDIEGSTALWERNQVAMATAVARHLTLLRFTLVVSFRECGEDRARSAR